jgi:branched-chain amino acid aminotransferase
MNKIFINGKMKESRDAKISVFDRGFLYGDGVFESFRTYHRKPFLTEEHLKRLLAGAKTIRLPLPYSLSKIKLLVSKIIATNRYPECYIKIILTRGEASGHGLNLCNVRGKPNLIILAEKFLPPPHSLFKRGWKVIISSVRKAETPTSRLKSLCYLDNAMARMGASQAGADEAIMLNEKGHVAEGSASNIFIIKSDTLITPPVKEPILAGITRNAVLNIARKAGIKIAEKPLFPGALCSCDECFATLSSYGIVPITKIDNKKIGSGVCGPITHKLISLYRAETGKDKTE